MFRKVHDQFTVRLRTEDGRQFHGQFGNPGAYPRPRKEIQNLPHRALVTARASVAQAGDLVHFAGVYYVLAGQHVLRDTKRFLAVEINAHMLWQRPIDEIDPVTNMSKGESLQEMSASLPVVVEPMSPIEEEGFSVGKNRIFTAASVTLGDHLDGMRVLESADLFGLRMLEVA